MRRIVECVPNFSEGRDAGVVNAIAEAVGRVPGIAVLGKTMDADHNRSVITFAGDYDGVVDAAVAGVAVAVERIDLTKHSGVHPRIGAADVLPFVPVESVTLDECVGLARQAGREIWERLRVPVYYYEAAALHPDRCRLENIRRGGWEVLRGACVSDPSRAPDLGGPELHPTAGAVVVGARKFLIAYNVNLRTDDLTIAKEIARIIRASSGGLPHVKALGLPLRTRGQVQVSVNLTDFESTPLHLVYDTICRQAHARGVQVAGSELIGFIPRKAIEAAAHHYFGFEDFHAGMILENRLDEVLAR